MSGSPKPLPGLPTCFPPVSPPLPPNHSPALLGPSPALILHMATRWQHRPAVRLGLTGVAAKMGWVTLAPRSGELRGMKSLWTELAWDQGVGGHGSVQASAPLDVGAPCTDTPWAPTRVQSADSLSPDQGPGREWPACPSAAVFQSCAGSRAQTLRPFAGPCPGLCPARVGRVPPGVCARVLLRHWGGACRGLHLASRVLDIVLHCP